jgi:NAD(P)-dependent dehydrogenase (short-subunit alcohol dehydrogenase family)
LHYYHLSGDRAVRRGGASPIRDVGRTLLSSSAVPYFAPRVAAGVGSRARRVSSATALVTGGGRGIGRAIALEMAREGFDVAVGYKQSSELAGSAAAEIRDLGRRAVAIAADVADPVAATRLVSEAVEELGRLDVLVSNAGSLVASPLLEVAPEEYDLQLDTNARGSFFVLQASAAQMIEQGDGGRIIMVSSEAAVRSYPGLSAYCMSKAAVKMLTEVAAHELAPHGILVNAVAPGTTETDLNREALADPSRREMLVGSILLGRPGRPEDVAAAAAFLASSRARHMTGCTIAVDGGAAIH